MLLVYFYGCKAMDWFRSDFTHLVSINLCSIKWFHHSSSSYHFQAHSSHTLLFTHFQLKWPNRQITSSEFWWNSFFLRTFLRMTENNNNLPRTVVIKLIKFNRIIKIIKFANFLQKNISYFHKLKIDLNVLLLLSVVRIPFIT